MIDYVYIIFATTFSVLEIILLTKLIGYRQIGELSIYDYINSITFGSIAADMATAKGKDFFLLALTLLLFGLYTYLFAILTDKSALFRKWVIGSPYVLYQNETIQYSSLKKAHIDLSEFLSTLRSLGVFDLSELEEVILETNGRFSLKRKYQKDAHILIKECKILPESLFLLKKDEKWLINELKKYHYELNQIYLATFNQEDGLIIYERESGKKVILLQNNLY